MRKYSIVQSYEFHTKSQYLFFDIRSDITGMGKYYSLVLGVWGKKWTHPRGWENMSERLDLIERMPYPRDHIPLKKSGKRIPK
jgi:hypothetical protein